MFSSRSSSPGPSLRQAPQHTSNLPRRREQADDDEAQFIPPRPKSPLTFSLKRFTGTSHPASPSSPHNPPHPSSNAQEEKRTPSSLPTATVDRNAAAESTKLPRVGALFRRKSTVSILSNHATAPISDDDTRSAPSQPSLSAKDRLHTPPRKGAGHPHRRSSSYSQIGPFESTQSSPRSPPAKRRVYDGSDVQKYIRHGNQNARQAAGAASSAGGDILRGRGQEREQDVLASSRPSSPSPRVSERPATSLGWSAQDRLREGGHSSGLDRNRTLRSGTNRRYSIDGEIEDLQSSNDHDTPVFNEEVFARDTVAMQGDASSSSSSPSSVKAALPSAGNASRRPLFERPGLSPSLARKGSKRAAPPQPLKFPSPGLDFLRSSTALGFNREGDASPFRKGDTLNSSASLAGDDRSRKDSQGSTGDSIAAGWGQNGKGARSPTMSAASNAASPSRIPFYRRMRSNSGGASSLLGASSSQTSQSPSTSPSSRRTLSVATARSFPKASSGSLSNSNTPVPSQSRDQSQPLNDSDNPQINGGSTAAARSIPEARTGLRSAPPDRSSALPHGPDTRPSSVMGLYLDRTGAGSRGISPRPLTSLEPSLPSVGSSEELPPSPVSAHRKKSPSVSGHFGHPAKVIPATTSAPTSSVASNLKSAGKRGWGMVRGWKDGASTASPGSTPTRKTFDGRLDRKSRPDTTKPMNIGVDNTGSVNEATRRWLSLPEAPPASRGESTHGLIFAVPLREAVIRTRLLSPRSDSWVQPPRATSQAHSRADVDNDPVYIIRPRPRRRPSQIGLLDLGSEFSLTSDIFSTSPTKDSSAGLPAGSRRSPVSSSKGDAISPFTHRRDLHKRIPVDRQKARVQYLPRFVTRCIESLEAHGIQEEGLYRLSGRTSHTSRLRHFFDGRLDAPIPADTDFEWDLDLRNVSPVECDINSVCSVLKAYLRDLPDTLLSPQQVQQIEVEARKHASDRDIDSEAVRHALEDVEPAQWYLLREISLHLGDLISEEVVKRTKMTMMNLSLVLAPTLSIPATSLRFMVQHRDMLFELGPKADPQLDKVREGGLLGGVVAKDSEELQSSTESSRASSPFTNSSFTFSMDNKSTTPKSFIPVASSRLHRTAAPTSNARLAPGASDQTAPSQFVVPATLPTSMAPSRRNRDELSVDAHSVNRNSSASVATVLASPQAQEIRHRATKSIASGQAPQLSLDLGLPSLTPTSRPSSASNSETKSHSHTNSSSTNFSSSSFSSAPPHSRDSSVDTNFSTAPDAVNSRHGLDLKELADALPQGDETTGATESILRSGGSNASLRSTTTGSRYRWETSSSTAASGTPPYLFRRKEPQSRVSPHPPIPQGLPISDSSSSLHSNVSGGHGTSLSSHPADTERFAISPAPSIASFQTSTSGGGSGNSSVSTLDRPHPLSASATAASQSSRGPGRSRSASTNFFASGTGWPSVGSGLSATSSRTDNIEAPANTKPTSTNSTPFRRGWAPSITAAKASEVVRAQDTQTRATARQP